MKKILITNEKHGQQYYDVSTPEQLNAVFVYLFNKRNLEGWYVDIANFTETKNEYPEIDFNKDYGDASVNQAIANLKKSMSINNDFNRNQYFLKRYYDIAISGNDKAKICFVVERHHLNYEYETYLIEEISELKNPKFAVVED